MKLVVSGSRSIKDKEVVFRNIYLCMVDICVDQIVCGGAKGVDMSAILWAMKEKVPYTVYLPNYNMYGKIAPLVRNEKMASYGNALLALWDGKSRGTIHMVSAMRRLDKPVVLINTNGKSREYTDQEQEEEVKKYLGYKGVERCCSSIY
jgi:hypothetical protein